MGLSNFFEIDQERLGQKIKVALICTICALLPYYAAVFTIDYPHTKWVRNDYYYYECMFRLVLGEEALYRLLPLMLVIEIFGVRWWVIFITILSTSTYFALIHNGYSSLLAIGPAAVLFSIAFLSFGGLNKKYLQAFIWCSLIHTAMNLIVFVFVPIVFY